MPLRFTMTSPPSGCQKDFHLRAVEHARHTKKGLTGFPARPSGSSDSGSELEAGDQLARSRRISGSVEGVHKAIASRQRASRTAGEVVAEGWSRTGVDNGRCGVKYAIKHVLEFRPDLEL